MIYNPAAGNGRDNRALIERRLSEHGIRAIFYETNSCMHAWKLAGGEINFAEHSALVAVGGDGTLHEVMNGMLQRADG